MLFIKQVAKVSAHVDDKAPEDLEDKEVASEAVERILNQKDQVMSVEEPTADIDDEKANELDIACAQTDTQDKGEEVCSLTFSTMMTTPTGSPNIPPKLSQ